MGKSGATVTLMAATVASTTMAPVDLLIGLRDRVPLSEAQVGRGTGAGEQMVRAWLERREAPDAAHAQRLTELVAFVEEMARNLTGETLAGSWLDGEVDVLSGVNSLDEIAAGHYERMIQYALGVSYGTFT